MAERALCAHLNLIELHDSRGDVVSKVVELPGGLRDIELRALLCLDCTDLRWRYFRHLTTEEEGD